MSKKLNRFLSLLLGGVFFLLSGHTLGAAEGRNPFTFPVGVLKGTSKQDGAASGQADKDSSPSFKVTTILVSGQTKVAAINGILLRKGEEINGYRVVEIEENRVSLKRGKEKVILKMEARGKALLTQTDAKK
jgi:hypothetical protein